MKHIKSHFTFDKKQRSGIFFLLLIIGAVQIVYFTVDFRTASSPQIEEARLLAFQQEIDSLKLVALENKKPKIFPFNPNYITDHKGYTLGMTPDEVDRLHTFREENKFVNSAKEFQQVTKVSDSLLAAISPFFKFPDWVIQRQKASAKKQFKKPKKDEVPAVRNDLNTASAEALKEISGIGDVLSKRIVKFRNRLGGFLSEEQLHDVYGLKPEVVERLLLRFELQSKPAIVKININEASISELAALVYFDYKTAKRIVAYRTQVGNIVSFDELTKIEGFPSEKINRIALYLTFE